MVRCRSGCSEVLNRETRRYDMSKSWKHVWKHLQNKTSTRTRSWEFSCCHPQIHRTLQKMILRIFVQALSCCAVACPHSLHLTSTSWKIQCTGEIFVSMFLSKTPNWPELQTCCAVNLKSFWELFGKTSMFLIAKWIGPVCDLRCSIFLATWYIQYSLNMLDILWLYQYHTPTLWCPNFPMQKNLPNEPGQRPSQFGCVAPCCCDAGTPRTGMVDLVDVVPPRFHDEGRWREGLPWN